MSKASTLYLQEQPPFPNSTLPVLMYEQVYTGANAPFARLFEQNGWTGLWVNGVYSFHHYHAAAHEVLGCIAGWAHLTLGGPGGTLVLIQKGDAVLLPAGIGHQLIKASPDFQVVGAYPKGQFPDLQRGDTQAYERLKAEAALVRLPDTDPVMGAGGAVAAHWQQTTI
ncbi:MAG: cupin [Clostridiales bacterium]|nr:cupin [Clostridiales bacterium]